MNGSTRSVFKMLRPYMAAEWRALALAAVATVAVVAAYLARPFPLAIAVDQIIGSHESGSFELSTSDWRLLLALAGGVLLIALVNALGSHLADNRLENAAEKIVHRLRVDTYARLQRLSLAYHDRQHTGDLVTRVTGDVEAAGSLFSDSLGYLASAAILLLGMLIVSLVIDPLLAITAFAASPALAFVAFRYGPQVRSLSQRRRSALQELASLSDESISSMRAVKAFGAERYEEQRLERKSEEIQSLGQAASRVEGRFSGLIDALGAVALALVVVVGVLRVAAGAISAGDLIVMYTYARRIDRPLRGLARGAARASRSLAGAESVAEVLAAEEVLEERPDAYHGQRARGELELRNVSFEYAPGRPAVSGLSLRIPPGQKVALVGRPGAGKSTVAALLARFYDPNSGQVMIDGRDARDCAVPWLREQFGLVLQETMLFTGTIAENIAYGIEAPRARIIAAAEAAGAHAFISDLPAGYETVLGPAGGGLSGGQRQRIAIARTLLRDPAILLLDEPTTALDAESEAQLLEGLEALMSGRTTLIITHFPGLAATADRAVALERGRLVADGPPQEVMPEPEPEPPPSLGNGGGPPAVAMPLDREIPALRAAADEGFEAVLARAGVQSPIRRIKVCKHHPGKRCTLFVESASGRLLVKAYAKDRAGTVRLLERFEREGLAGGRPPCAPALAAYEPSLFVIAMEWFAAPSAKDLIAGGSGRRAGELAAAWLRATVAARIELGRARGAHEIVARAQRERWIENIHQADPALGSEASAQLEALATRLPSEPTRVFQHGSFRPSCVLDLGDGPGVIDWDSFCQGPPELDPAMFLAALSRLAAINPELRAASEEAAQGFREGVGDLIDEESLAWHRSAALLKCASWQTNRRTYVQRWREQAEELLRASAAAW